jgi:hypothetical protein
VIEKLKEEISELTYKLSRQTEPKDDHDFILNDKSDMRQEELLGTYLEKIEDLSNENTDLRQKLAAT